MHQSRLWSWLAVALAAVMLASSTHAAGGPPSASTLAYQERLGTAAVAAVMPSLMPRVDQFMAAGGVHIECRINARGQVQDVKVRTGRPNRFVQETCVKVLRRTTFPKIPKEVQTELRKNWLDFTVQFGG
jgi:TonB family protein